MGAVPLVGKWARFDGNAANYIVYPHLVTRNRTAITIGCWHRLTSDTGTTRVMIGQGSSAVWPTNMEFMLYFHTSNRPAIFINIAGVGGIALTATTAVDHSRDRLTIATWESGDVLRIYTNGEPDGTGVNQPGVIADVGSTLVVGNRTDLGVPFIGDQAEPILDFRRWSEAEIRNYYRRSLFH